MADLLIGYAIGTAQIVILEWFRERAAHRRALRLYRFELQRLQGFDAKYRWSRTDPPNSNTIPKPPSLSSSFQSLVAGIAWPLTDGHRNDDSALAAITIGDLCDTMQRYSLAIQELLDRADRGDVLEARAVLPRVIEVAQQYDLEVDQFLYVLAEAVRDVDGRLRRAGFFPQLWRTVTPLRHGTNPAPVSPTDPRVREFAAKRERQVAKRRLPDA